jgi:hypothetical protein
MDRHRTFMKAFPILVASLVLSSCVSERITRPATTAETTRRPIAAVATDVVYYLDGKEITAKQVEAIDPKTIHEVEVIKGESARRMLGDRAAYGVVMITSKALPSR